MQLPLIIVTFDDGERVEVQATSRDLFRLEKLGMDLEQLPPMEGTYTLALTAMRRMVKQGLVVRNQLPEKADELADIADIEAEVTDPLGEGSGQAPTPG